MITIFLHLQNLVFLILRKLVKWIHFEIQENWKAVNRRKIRYHIVLCKLPNANDYNKSRNNKFDILFNMSVII
jgi:hypothetical protein